MTELDLATRQSNEASHQPWNTKVGEGMLAYCTRCGGGEIDLEQECCNDRIKRKEREKQIGIKEALRIKTKDENPDGLHLRYEINPLHEQWDPSAMYFVLRLDAGALDRVHLAACRSALRVYATIVGRAGRVKLEHDIATTLNILQEQFNAQNPYGYNLDSRGNIKCPNCDVRTNPDYAILPNLKCHACGARMGLAQ